MTLLQKISASISIFVALALAYTLDVSPEFSGHPYFPLPTSISLPRIAICLSIYIGTAAALPMNRKSAIDFFNFIGFVFFLLPMSVVTACDAERPLFPLVCTSVAILVASHLARGLLSLRRAPGRPRGSAQKREKSQIVSVSDGGDSASAVSGNIYAFAFVILVIAAYVALIIQAGALSLTNLSLQDIYLYRRDQQALIGGGIAGYLSVWVPKIFNPLLMITFFYRKNRALLLATLALQIFFFATTSNREILFIPVLVIASFLFFKHEIRYDTSMIAIAGVFIFLTILGPYIEQWYDINNLLLRRAFFVPVSATFIWFDYFSYHGFVSWSDRILSTILPTAYTGYSIPYLIGDAIARGRDVSANTGLVATGYANFGLVGVVVYAAILAGILALLQKLADAGVPLWIMASLLANPIRSAWSDSDLFTAISSHGIAIAIVLLFLFFRNRGLGQQSNASR